MRAMLVSMAGPPATPSYFMPDNGLAALAACLIGEGHEVEVHDLNTLETMRRLTPPEIGEALRPYVERRLEGRPSIEGDDAAVEAIQRRLDAHRADEYARMGRELAARAAATGARLIGLKLWCGDGWTGSLAMARAIREVLGDRVAIVGGGPHVDFFGEALLRPEGTEAFDALSVGEGEPTIVALAGCLDRRERLDEVPNLILPAPGGGRRTAKRRVASLDALPLGVYGGEVYPLAGRLLVATHEETRGCPHHCAFCNHPLKAGHRMRVKEPSRFVDEMLALAGRYGFRGFRFGGSFTPSKYVRRVALEILARGTRIPFCGYGRVSASRQADFRLFREAGCEALFFGIESGSQLILDNAVAKGHRVGEVEAVLRASREAGIFTIASIIYPNPGETEESRQVTLDLLARARPDGAPVHYPMLVPGSQWFEQPERYGFAVEDREAYTQQIARWNPRLLFPPSLVDALDYRVDGKPYARFAAETAAFAREVEALGVVTLISDEASMLARLAGEAPRAFRDRLRIAFLTGEVNVAEEMIATVNRAPAIQPGGGAAAAS